MRTASPSSSRARPRSPLPPGPGQPHRKHPGHDGHRSPRHTESAVRGGRAWFGYHTSVAEISTTVDDVRVLPTVWHAINNITTIRNNTRYLDEHHQLISVRNRQRSKKNTKKSSFNGTPYKLQTCRSSRATSVILVSLIKLSHLCFVIIFERKH